MLFLRWLNELRRELAALITGSLLLAALGIYQTITGRSVSPWLYFAIVLLFFCWASYRVWAKENLKADAALKSVYEGRPLFTMRIARMAGSEEFNLYLSNCGGRPARHISLESVRSYNENYTLAFDEVTVLQSDLQGTPLAYTVKDKSRKSVRLLEFLRDNPSEAAVVWWDIHIKYWDTDNAIKDGGVIRLCFDVEGQSPFVRAAPYTARGFKPPSRTASCA